MSRHTYKSGDRVRLYSVNYPSQTGIVKGIDTGRISGPDPKSFQLLTIIGEKGERYCLPASWVSPIS